MMVWSYFRLQSHRADAVAPQPPNAGGFAGSSVRLCAAATAPFPDRARLGWACWPGRGRTGETLRPGVTSPTWAECSSRCGPWTWPWSQSGWCCSAASPCPPGTGTRSRFRARWPSSRCAVRLLPERPARAGAVGFYVDTMPKALLAAAAALLAFLLFSYVVVITARMHARVARGLLRPPSDPLAGAREILSRPGPLPALGGRNGGRREPGHLACRARATRRYRAPDVTGHPFSRTDLTMSPRRYEGPAHRRGEQNSHPHQAPRQLAP